MSIRLPLKTVLDYDDGAVGAGQTGATSVAGGVAKTFTLPQDTDNVVVKLTASVIGGGVSVTFQTTDDGGTTWFDVARSSVVSNTAGNQNAEWLSVPTAGTGVATAVNGFPTACILSVATGSSGASTLGVRQVSGLPILGPLNRIFYRYTAAVTGTDLARVKVMANNQSTIT